MSLSGEPWQPILDTLAQLRAGWPSPEWTWDPRLECATSSFEVSLVPGVRPLSERCGSLRSNQLLLTGHGVAGMFPFALWWPWGEGSKVSVRLGIMSADRPKEISPRVRAVFGIP